MNLPSKPMIAEAVLRRVARPYDGPIKPGDVFAWEPDLPHARELVVVVRVEDDGDETRVWTRNIDGDEEHWNPEDVFREAVVPTIMKPHTPRRDPGTLMPWPFR